jgi:hypothetical protein
VLRSKFPRVSFDAYYPPDPTAAVNKNGKIYLLKVFCFEIQIKISVKNLLFQVLLTYNNKRYSYIYWHDPK